VIDAVVFDVGETLVDETREYGTWADWLGVLLAATRKYGCAVS
jgi:FMN phosphatase YigB (HAD superfamily)